MNTLFPPINLHSLLFNRSDQHFILSQMGIHVKKKKGGGGGTSEQAAKIKEKFPDQINKLCLLNKELGR